MDNYEDKQTIYKTGDQSYNNYAKILKEKGYTILKDDDKKSVFVLLKKSK